MVLWGRGVEEEGSYGSDASYGSYEGVDVGRDGGCGFLMGFVSDSSDAMQKLTGGMGLRKAL